MNLDLDKLQEENATWVHKNFPGRPWYQPVLGLMEELGELSHSTLKREQKIRLDELHNAKIKDAIGDIVIYLLDFCNTEGVLLSDCINVAWNEVKDRDWTKHREEHKV